MNRPELSVRRCQPADWETIIAIANRAFREIRRYTREQLGDKLADLAYHAMVLMVQMGITVEDVHQELASRHIIDHKVKQEKMTT